MARICAGRLLPERAPPSTSVNRARPAGCGSSMVKQRHAGKCGKRRLPIDQERYAPGGGERGGNPPDLTCPKFSRRHGRKLRRKPKSGLEREHGEGRKAPEHALAPVENASGKLAHPDEQKSEADSGEHIGGKREGGALEAVLRRPAAAMLMLSRRGSFGLMHMRRRRLCLSGLLEDFSLENERHRRHLLRDGHADACDRADNGREQDDVAEIIHVALP